MATRLCWLGHACLLLESDGTRALIDPFLSDSPIFRYRCFQRAKLAFASMVRRAPAAP